MSHTVRGLSLCILLSIFSSVALLLGCGISKPHVRAAKQVERDFYACKGFKHGIPVEATSEFSVSDGLVYVVADLEKEQVGSRLDFEIASPLGKIAYFESVKYEQNRPYGIYFDTWKLLERGGPGKWKVLFWADGQPVGRLSFNLEGPPGHREAWRRGEAGSGTIFERLFGEEARPKAMPAPTAEEEEKEVPAVMESPEDVPLAPVEELVTPESESTIELGTEPEAPDETAEDEN